MLGFAQDCSCAVRTVGRRNSGDVRGNLALRGMQNRGLMRCRDKSPFRIRRSANPWLVRQLVSGATPPYNTRPGVTVLNSTRRYYSPSRAAARAPSVGVCGGGWWGGGGGWGWGVGVGGGAATSRVQAAARCGLAGPLSENSVCT